MAGLSATLVAPGFARGATATDSAGRAVPVPANVARVFPAGPPAAILLYTLAPELLIGWPRANRPEECAYMLPEICTRPEVGRITGRGNTANLETVLALKPDLILDVGSTSATFVSLADRVQEQTHIPYALLDGRFDAIAKTYRSLGELIGRAEDAEKLARYTEDTLEQILVWNPDVIVTIDQEFTATVRNDPSWASVKAVRDNRVHLSPKMPFGWVDFPPSVNRLIGLWWLAKLLYPERFPEDLRTLTAEFYTRFYHVTPTAAQIDHVLAGRD